MFILFWRSAWRRFGWENTYLFLFLFIKIWGSDKLIKIDLNKCRIYKKNQTKLFSTIWFFSITNCFFVPRIYWGQDISFTFWFTLSKLPNFRKEMHKESSALYISLLAPSFGSLRTLCALYLPCLLLWLAKHFVCFICIACLCGLLSTLCALFALLAFVAC